MISIPLDKMSLADKLEAMEALWADLSRTPADVPVPQWHREGHYDAIAEQLFSELNHHRLLLEYDSERAGSFAPLRFVKKGTIAVLGLVSTKTEELEPVDSLKRRLEDASRYLPMDQLAISPQCGFGSNNPENARLAENLQWRKLERVLAVANAVWS